MKYFIFFICLVIVIFSFRFFDKTKNSAQKPSEILVESKIQNSAGDVSVANPIADSAAMKDSEFTSPLSDAKARVTKKPFGIFINQKTSPVQPERFFGYHTGTDFEIFPEELSIKVDVRVICDGKLVLKKSASGYGGVAVQSCVLDNQPVTVVYGHLKLASIIKNVGEDLKAGEIIGQLGAAHSTETDDERKHLHLSIRKGLDVNILGYVKTQSALNGWIDPCLFACG